MIICCIQHYRKIVVLAPLHESDAYTVSNQSLAGVVSHNKLPLAIISNKDPRLGKILQKKN